MPEFKKLSKEDVERMQARPAARGPSQRARIRQEYREYLGQFRPEDWVEVTLTEGEKRQTVKNRLNRAAEELGYELRFRRTRGSIRFEIAKRG